MKGIKPVTNDCLFIYFQCGGMSGGYLFNRFNIFIPGDTLFTVFFLLLARKLDMGYLGVCRHGISDIRTAMSWLWFVAGGFLCWSLVFWGTMLRADENFKDGLYGNSGHRVGVFQTSAGTI